MLDYYAFAVRLCQAINGKRAVSFVGRDWCALHQSADFILLADRYLVRRIDQRKVNLALRLISVRRIDQRKVNLALRLIPVLVFLSISTIDISLTFSF
jgi:hypothetical protein